MNIMILTRSVMLIGCLVAAGPAAAVIDCRTPEGQLALMAARVVVGNPQSPANLPISSTSLPFRATSELFRVAQDETTNSGCSKFVQPWIWVSKSSDSLSILPTIASRATSDTWSVKNTLATKMPFSRSGNVLTLSGSFSRGSFFPAGSTMYYRIGKQIVKEGAVDPYVFSPVFSFVVPAPPVVKPLPNLIPQPTLSMNRNRPLFRPAGGSYGAAGESFLAVPSQFCASMSASTAQSSNYQCAVGTCRKLRQDNIPLPPVNYWVRNIGQAAAEDPTDGLFEVSLQRREMVRGVNNQLTTVHTGLNKRVEPGADGPIHTFKTDRTVTLFQFPDDNPGSCFSQCLPDLPGCTLAYQEVEYRVLADGGNASQGSVLESNETDDEGNPMGQ